MELTKSTEGEHEENKARRGGSRPGKRPNLNRDFAAGHAKIMSDYFVENPVYHEDLFRRRFQMSNNSIGRSYKSDPVSSAAV
jgi:hypothetical protein